MRRGPALAAAAAEKDRADRWIALAVLAAAAAWVAFLLPGIALGECLFYGDFHAVFQPLRAALGRALSDGLPLWTDELSHGQPLLASPFAAAGYLPNAVFAIAPGASGRLLTLLTAAHLAWGALGTFLLAHRRGSTRAAALGASVIWASSGAVLSGTYMTLLSCSAAWLPWFLLAVDRVLVAPSGRAALRQAPALLAATVLLVTAGDPFVAASACLGAAITARPAGDPAGTGRASRWRRVPVALLGAGLGLAAVSPLLAAMVAFVRETGRGGGLPMSEVLDRSLHPLALFGLVIPDAFGSVFTAGEGAFFAPGLHGAPAPLFPSLYAGALVLTLAVRGSLSREPGAGREAAWFGLQMVLAVGKHGFLYPALAALPLVASSRFPAKWALPAMLPLALLAARGVDAAARAARSGRSTLRVPVASLAILSALAVAMTAGADRAVAALLPGPLPAHAREAELPTTPLAEEVRRRFLAGALRTSLPLVGALLAGALAARRRSGPIAASTLVLFVAADLSASARESARTVPPGFYDRRPAAVDALLADGAARGRVWVDASPEARAVPVRLPLSTSALEDVARLRRETLDGLIASSYGLRLAFPGDLERLSTTGYEQYRRLVETLPPRARGALLRAASVSHVVSPLDRAGEGVEPFAAVPGLREPRLLYRVRGPLPDVRVVGELRVHDGPGGLARILEESPPDLVERAAFIDRGLLPGAGRRVLPPGSTGPTEGPWNLRVARRRSAHLEAEVSGPAGFLVVSGTFAPGWQARVDGRSAPIVPVNLAFRCVPFPPGTHVVEMSYSPF